LDAAPDRTTRPTPPGEILAEVLASRGITMRQFAEACGCSIKHVREIVHDRAAITPQMAIRMATALGDSTPEYWLALSNAVALYDVRDAVVENRYRPRRYPPTRKGAPRPVAERGDAPMT
jgi:addiction module HigA family antidote